MGYPRVLHKVRFVPGGGFEMQCADCRLYVPLVEDEWVPASGLSRCASCWRDYYAMKQRGYNRVEATAELKRTRAKLDYALNRDERRRKNREWKARNRERIAAYNRAYRERNRQKLIDQSRAYYDECRDVLLAKKRQAYAEARAA